MFFHSDICPDNWRYFQGYCYRKVSPCNSWSNSQSQCAILGANLPSVHSQEENVFVQSLHGGESGWLGLSDINTEGTFVWSDGSRLSFNFWATRQPNNFHNEDCVHTLGSLKNHEYKWNDVNCSSCHTYSCKKGIDSTSRFYCFNRTHFFVQWSTSLLRKESPSLFSITSRRRQFYWGEESVRQPEMGSGLSCCFYFIYLFIF